MNLFIDTNIFIDFYRRSSADIEELQKLVEYIVRGKFALYVPDQIRKEVERNRDTTISNAVTEFKNQKFELHCSVFFKHYAEYEEINAFLKVANKKHAELREKANQDIQNRGLAADKLIQDLFDKAKKIETNQQLFEAAKKRYRLGNPPGKDKVTIGDQINWEALLAEVPDGEDLIVISGDQDYCSAINKDAINQFLLEEWREKKKSQIVFFKSLSAFLKVKIPEIKLNDERETTKLIEQLAQSGSFATTHAVIASLSKFVDFPQNQVEDLVKIAELNNQVGWIIGDDDVFDFYQVILNKYGDVLDPKLKEALEGIMRQAKSELDDANDDELPF